MIVHDLIKSYTVSAPLRWQFEAQATSRLSSQTCWDQGNRLSISFHGVQQAFKLVWHRHDQSIVCPEFWAHHEQLGLSLLLFQWHGSHSHATCACPNVCPCPLLCPFPCTSAKAAPASVKVVAPAYSCSSANIGCSRSA